ncbi:MAG: Hpt domain-containing protein [Burkholderiaceae bacterium]
MSVPGASDRDTHTATGPRERPSMQIDLKKFQETFFEEAAEHLSTMESGLLHLEESSSDREFLNTIFRAAHSIKGAAGSFDFKEIVRLTHVMENVFDRLRSNLLAPSADLTQILLRASDRLREVVDATRRGEPSVVPIDDVVPELEAVLHGAQPSEAGVAAAVALSGEPRGEVVYSVSFEPEREFSGRARTCSCCCANSPSSAKCSRPNAARPRCRRWTNSIPSSVSSRGRFGCDPPAPRTSSATCSCSSRDRAGSKCTPRRSPRLPIRRRAPPAQPQPRAWNAVPAEWIAASSPRPSVCPRRRWTDSSISWASS